MRRINTGSCKATLLALCLALPGATAALAQAQSQSQSEWGKPADLKPLVPPLPRVFIPPNAAITSGPASSGSSSTPLYDPTRDQATPGLRLTIPTR